jgi:Asp-tRNA(Asn)/Glu-tRNA(Gln) amidotransferase A subunit family amidase
MAPTRREALIRLAALAALPRATWETTAADPLEGTIAEYQAGRRQGQWSAAEVTAAALERCHRRYALARDALTPEAAFAEATASDARMRAAQLRGPLDGVPVFAKSIYDVRGLPTTGSSAEWARLFPEPVGRDATEVARLRQAGAVILGKTAADDFAYRGSAPAATRGRWPTRTTRPGHGHRADPAPGQPCGGGGMAFVARARRWRSTGLCPVHGRGRDKPTFGLVPRTGVIPTWPCLDTHSPLARGVADAAHARGALAWTRGPARPAGSAGCLAALRIARRSPGGRRLQWSGAYHARK